MFTLLLLAGVYLMQEAFAWPSEVMAVPVLIGAAALFAARPGDIPEIEAMAAAFDVWLHSLRGLTAICGQLPPSGDLVLANLLQFKNIFGFNGKSLDQFEQKAYNGGGLS